MNSRVPKAYEKILLDDLHVSLAKYLPAHEVTNVMGRIGIRATEEGIFEIIVDDIVPSQLLAALRDATRHLPHVRFSLLPREDALVHLVDTPTPKSTTPPQFGERVLLLLLTKEQRANIPGDLEEEFKEIAAKHGARYAKLWYYKQVAASAWPLMQKAVKWGVWAWIANVARRII